MSCGAACGTCARDRDSGTATRSEDPFEAHGRWASRWSRQGRVVRSWWMEEFVQLRWGVRGSARGWWVGGLALALSACGGGGGSGAGGDPGGGGGGSDPALSLAAKGAFGADDVGHLLNRTRFGPTAADVAAVQQMGVPAFID